jgi:hypothetical protein
VWRTFSMSSSPRSSTGLRHCDRSATCHHRDRDGVIVVIVIILFVAAAVRR